MARVTVRIECEYGDTPESGLFVAEGTYEGAGLVPIDWVGRFADHAGDQISAIGYHRRMLAERDAPDGGGIAARASDMPADVLTTGGRR